MTRRQAVRDRWYWTVIKTDLVAGSCREVLSLIAVHHMSELGHVDVPRKTLAKELGIAEHRVTVRIGEAVKAGLLTRVAGGDEILRAVCRRINLLDPVDALAKDTELLDRAAAIVADLPRVTPPDKASTAAALRG